MTEPVSRTSRPVHLLFWGLVFCLVLFFTWALVFELDTICVARGRVVPSGRVKSIQHFEGGIVRELLVKEGDRVAKDQPLVVLEKTASGADVAQLTVRMAALRLEMIRLEAEIGGRDTVVFPEDLTAGYPDQAARAAQMFDTRRSLFLRENARQEQVVLQRRQDVAEYRQKIDTHRKELKLLSDQVAISTSLLSDKLTSEYTHLALLREQNQEKSRLSSAIIALDRAESALREAEEKSASLELSYRKEAEADLAKAMQSYEELSQRMKKYADSFNRTEIRSPVAGTVKRLYVVTRGGVVQPGMTVLDVVPVEDTLVIEARLEIADIGYVHGGQSAVVNLASSDSRRFGNLSAEVAGISPDAFTAPDGKSFYTVRLKTSADRFFYNGSSYLLYPGVEVVAYIRTGSRTVMHYLLDPFLGGMRMALGER